MNIHQQQRFKQRYDTCSVSRRVGRALKLTRYGAWQWNTTILTHKEVSETPSIKYSSQRRKSAKGESRFCAVSARRSAPSKFRCRLPLARQKVARGRTPAMTGKHAHRTGST